MRGNQILWQGGTGKHGHDQQKSLAAARYRERRFLIWEEISEVSVLGQKIKQRKNTLRLELGSCRE